MSNSRIIFIIISLFIIIRTFIIKDLEVTAIITLGVLVAGSMIWFTDFWTVHLLPFGFWESKATDFKTSGNSSAALVFLAWVSLLLMGWGTLQS